MPTTLTKGDLFATHHGGEPPSPSAGLKAFAHTVNCAGTMDVGVSVAFKKRWPRMFDDYAQRCADKRIALGDVFVWNEDDVVVYGLATQLNWRSRSKVSALSRAVRKMLELAAIAGVDRIGVPRIGVGLGGIDWHRVRSVLVDEGSTSSVELVVFEQFIRATPPEA